MAKAPQIGGNLVGASSFETAALQTRVALPSEIDELGHVNNAVYLVWAQEVAVAHWRAMTSETMRGDLIWVVLRHEIDYRDPVLPGETVEVRTWLGRASGPRFERHIDIRKPGAARPCAKVLTDWCLLDARSRKPKRVGEEILTLFGVSG
ncbi:MAG: acyl-CoA thioesterase [Amphiplicatus sp.]|nr:acyl-CoA thioesterase [Amphiplicatus sp.]